MTFEEFIKSKRFKNIVSIAAGLIVLVVVFAGGIFVGLEKARFSYRYGENYRENFGRPLMQGGMFPDRDFLNPHGESGQVIKIENDTITVKDDDNIEKNIVVDAMTVIEENRNNIKLSDLKVNDNIVVIGVPDNQGQITAKLIRVFPNPLQ